MHFHAFAVFLAMSSVSGLAVPKSRDPLNADVEDSIKSTWVGMKTTTIYPGATPPEPSVPRPNPPSIDEDAVLRRAGLILAKRDVPTVRRRRGAGT